MHVSAIDAPSDRYGAVTDVARPLLHRMNGSTMSRSTYEALEELLEWSLKTLRGPIKADLYAFEGKVEEPAEIELPETPQDEQTQVSEGVSDGEPEKEAVAPEKGPAEDSDQKEPEKPAVLTNPAAKKGKA